MKVLNIHRRKYNESIDNISELISTLATKKDKVWPQETWPAMRFRQGFHVNAHGGHGPIRYYIQKLEEGQLIEFRFTSPKEFDGIHKLEINEISSNTTELVHTIDMKTSFIGTLKWITYVRPLHDALIEEALDKVGNNFSTEKASTPYSPWVRFLRAIFKGIAKK